MIGMLTGRIESVETDSALICVGGVGYETRMSRVDLSSLHSGQEVRAYTSMNVSQDAITLYGFLSSASKRMFLQVQKVSGIGPRVALSLLSTLTPEQLAKAVSDGDTAALARAPGLGRKGAQKIILELRGTIDLSQIQDGKASGSTRRDQGLMHVVEGLISLGWRQTDAEDAVHSVCEDNGIALPLDALDVPRVLKLALTSMDRGR